MKHIYHIVIFCLTFGIILSSFSCKKDKEIAGTINPEGSISFAVSHQIDNLDLETDTIKYININNDTFSVINLRYFISKIYVHNNDDSVLLKNYQYVDINDVRTLTFNADQSVKNGNYKRVSLIIGLDEELNTNGYFVNPPEANMVWPNPMGGGFHYMQLEGKFYSTGAIKNYNTHTGKLMNTHRYIRVQLDNSSLTVTGNHQTISLTMNINEWFKNPHVYDFNVYGEAIMGNHTAQTILQENGVNAFSVVSIK